MTVHHRNDTAHDYGDGFAETTLKLLPNCIADAKAVAGVLGHETLRHIACEVIETVRSNVTIGRTLREHVRANLRRAGQAYLAQARLPVRRAGAGDADGPGTS